jgi:DNA-binding MarR family transcriptional regulator
MLSSIPHLLVRSARVHRGLTAEPLQSLGLSSGEDLVLAELWQEDGLTQADLARRLALRRSTVTTVLHTMEGRGLVRRGPDARDGRVIRVHFTELSEALRPAIEEVWQSAERRLLRDLSRSEARALRQLLERANRRVASTGID